MTKIRATMIVCVFIGFASIIWLLQTGITAISERVTPRTEEHTIEVLSFLPAAAVIEDKAYTIETPDTVSTYHLSNTDFIRVADDQAFRLVITDTTPKMLGSMKGFVSYSVYVPEAEWKNVARDYATTYKDTLTYNDQTQ